LACGLVDGRRPRFENQIEQDRRVQMIEQLFGSGSPMWTAIPSSAFAFQTPIGVGNQPVGTPMFGSPANPGNGVSIGAQGISATGAFPTNTPSYGGGLQPSTVPQGLYGPSLFGAFPFAPGPLASPLVGPVGADVMAGVTAPSLLAAVAMRRGQPQGPVNDQEAEDFLYDALELLPGAADVEIRCEGGRATLTGSVQHKRVKRDVGEIAWAIPGLNDVQNNVTIASRRRTRAASGRDADTPANASARKQG
jgi:hypothetical protein